MSFDIEKFAKSPTQEQFILAKKPDLLKIAEKFGLSDIKTSMRKQEVINILVQYFIEEDVFTDEAESLIKPVGVSRAAELELELKLRRFKLER